MADMHCPECGQPAHAYVEQCPQAKVYHDGGSSACENYYVRYNEGRILAIALANGSITEIEYYEEVITGTEMMHNAGACGL
jgi:hypothetical protein